MGVLTTQLLSSGEGSLKMRQDIILSTDDLLILQQRPTRAEDAILLDMLHLPNVFGEWLPG